MKVKRDYILLEAVEDEQEGNLIVVPNKTVTTFKVVGIGPGAYYGSTFVETTLKEGSVVVLREGGFYQEIAVEGNKYKVANESDVVVEL